jgi:hypothetical protein
MNKAERVIALVEELHSELKALGIDTDDFDVTVNEDHVWVHSVIGRWNVRKKSDGSILVDKENWV